MCKCKRCGRVLTNPESIERKYGSTCWNIVQLQKKNENLTPDRNFEQELEFLKYEIRFLKRQLKEIKQNSSIINVEPIDRIKHDKERPERANNEINLFLVVKELKIIFEDKEIFDYHQILSPIEPTTKIESPPEILN